MPILLPEADVKAMLPMPDLIEAMEQALASFSRGEVQQPLRTVLEVGAQRAFFGVMPAYVPSPPALGTKLVTVYGSNPAQGLPTHLATILLLDPATGELLALLDGRYITEARTAAVSAVSVKHLARKDARTLAVIGTGVQARSHVEALPHVRRFEEIRVWSPTKTHRDAFVRDAEAHTRALIGAMDSVEQAVSGADVIVLATSSREPVLREAWVADGTHICAVGACRPDQREMEGELVGRARTFVDSRVGAMSEAGDILLAIREGACGADPIAGELGAVVDGQLDGRTSEGEVTLFKSLGMAVEDIAAAHLAYQRATERGLGRGFLL